MTFKKKNPLFPKGTSSPFTEALEASRKKQGSDRKQLEGFSQNPRVNVGKQGEQQIVRGDVKTDLSREEAAQYREIQKYGIPEGQEKFYSEKLRSLASIPDPSQAKAMLGQQDQQRQANLMSIQANQELPLNMDFNKRQLALATAGDPSAWKTVGAMAAGGAIAGSAIPGVGNIGGAIVGGALGIAVSIKGNLDKQEAGNIQAIQSIGTDNQRYANQLITLMNQDPDNAIIYNELYEQSMSKHLEAYEELQRRTQRDLNLYLNKDATKELQKYANFYGDGGMKQILDMKKQMALENPQALMMSSMMTE